MMKKSNKGESNDASNSGLYYRSFEHGGMDVHPASLFVAVALMFFAYSTILGWSLYGTRCAEYLVGMKATKVYQVIFVLMIVVGATTSLDVVWDVADTFNGLMAIPNFVALFALWGVVAKLTREYFRKQKDLRK